MALFFLVVGLEISREVTVGELRNRRTVVVPALGAVGGLVLPALIYLAFNSSGPAAVGWGILDAVVDDYRPAAESLERDIEEVEHAIFAAREDSTERIYFLRREVSDFYRTVHPLLEPLDALERGAFGQIDPALRRYFRDITDHVRRVHEEVVAQREQLTTALDANVSLLSVRQNQIAARQNEIVKQLTLMASLFLPLAFVTGFFGQNFGWLVDHIGSFADFLTFGIGGLALAGGVLLALFRRGHYI
jgi:magnesium transporter